MNDNINLLRDYICEYWSYKKDKIVTKTTLDDLGMFGNDKYNFLRFFFKKKLTQKYDVKSISIEMLLNSIKKGEWTES